MPNKIFCDTWSLMFYERSGAWFFASYSNLASIGGSSLARLSIAYPRFLSLRASIVPITGIVTSGLSKCSDAKVQTRPTHFLTFRWRWVNECVSFKRTIKTSRLHMIVLSAVTVCGYPPSMTWLGESYEPCLSSALLYSSTSKMIGTRWSELWID